MSRASENSESVKPLPWVRVVFYVLILAAMIIQTMKYPGLRLGCDGWVREVPCQWTSDGGASYCRVCGEHGCDHDR